MNMEEDIKQAVEVMRRGGVILYPTDTIWGIGCDATNEEAVRRVYDIKRRDDSKALICLVDSADRMQRYVGNVPAVTWDLVELSEKPLTCSRQTAAWASASRGRNSAASCASVSKRPSCRHRPT